MNWGIFQGKAEKRGFKPVWRGDILCLEKEKYGITTSFQSDGSVFVWKKEDSLGFVVKSAKIIAFERTPLQMWHLMLGLEEK